MFLFRYKSNFSSRRRSKKCFLRKREARIYGMLDRVMDVLSTTVEREAEEDNIKLIGWWGKDAVWQRLAALDINADGYRARQRWRLEVDYEFVKGHAEFKLQEPDELSWPRYKVDTSGFPPDAAKLKSGQWFSIHGIERMAGVANDRWMYLVKSKRKRLKYAPGEWLYFDRKELGVIFPSLGLKKKKIADRNAFLIHVIRGQDGIPTQLWVYSSNYKPLFKTTLNFIDPLHPVHDNKRGSWWHNNCFAWVFHEQYLKEDEIERVTRDRNDIQRPTERVEGAIPVPT